MNLKERVELLAKAKSNPKLQALEIEMCRRNPIYFFNSYLYTDKNKTIFTDESPDVLPFILFPFQEEYVTEIWKSIIEGNKPVAERDPNELTNVFIEKSRQMGLSWMTCGIFLYGFLFHQHKYTIISRTADEVDKLGDMDSMFEKIRFMIRNLPSWMLPRGFSKEMSKDRTNAYMNISDPNSQASITGKTANPDAGRGGTRNAIFMDEMAFMQNAQAINKAATSNTSCVIYNSTPNGEGNEFYRMRKLTMNRKWPNGDILPPEIKWLRYHWTDHPYYDKEWYEAKIKGKSKETVAQEFEISYNTAIVWRVYPEFPPEPSVVLYDPNKPLYVSIDNSHWWIDPNAVIIMQPDWIYWNIIDYIEYNSTPEDSAYFLKWQPKMVITDTMAEFLNRYKTYNYMRAVFIADPYDTKSALWNSTILDDYRKVGINLLLPQERKKEEQIMKTKTNMYRIRYSEHCLDFASCMMNAKYPERNENSQSTRSFTLPIHDWTSHARTSFEYLCTYLVENPTIEKKKVIDTRPRRDFATWRLIYPR